MKTSLGASLRRLLCLMCVAGVVAAADYKLDTVAGTLVFNVDVNWTEHHDFPDDWEGVVGFRVGDGSTMQWLVQPAGAAGRRFSSQGDVRDLTLEMQEQLREQGGEFSGGLLPIEGGRARGFYFKAIDPAPRPGEWKYIYAGWVSVDSHPVMFNIVWNEGGQSSADRALASVRSMRLQR